MFQLAGQALGSLGLQTDEAVTRLRLSSYWSDVLNFNGPDYKVLAVTAVPEPETYALMLSGLGTLVLLSRRRTLRRRGTFDAWPYIGLFCAYAATIRCTQASANVSSEP